MVVILLTTLSAYVIMVIPAIRPDYLSLREVILPDSGISTLFVASAIVGGSMQGGEILMNFTEEIDNPRRNIPLAFTISTTVVALLCILIAVVTLGTYPRGELQTLADSARIFMGDAGVAAFIIGGACLGCLSSMNSVIMSASRIIGTSADEKIFPAFMAKRNTHHVLYVSTCLVSGGAAMLCALNLDVFTLLTAITPISTIMALCSLISPFIISRRYPNTFKTNFFNLGKTEMDILNALAIAMTLLANVSLLSELTLTNNLIMLVLLVICYVCFALRIIYLKKRGFDLVAEMKKPYEPWEEIERSLTAQSTTK